jgi:hypothetical protein
MVIVPSDSVGVLLLLDVVTAGLLPQGTVAAPVSTHCLANATNNL